MPQPGQPGVARTPLAPGQPYGAAPGQLPDANNPEADADPGNAAGLPGSGDAEAAHCTELGADAPTSPSRDAPEQDIAPHIPEPAITTPPAPEPEPVPDAPSTPTPPPGITLPFGIVIPLPAPPPPPPAG
ncbi:hypothetical protein IU483_21365 [Streptomyces gardneri]|nr:hypothetical protein [Streptomyces gardneri]